MADLEGASGSADRRQPAPDDTPTGRLVALTDRAASSVTTPEFQGADRADRTVPDAAGERGSLTIEDTVVQKVAVAAAGEISGVGGAARRVLGVTSGRGDTESAAARRPRVTAHVTGQTAALDILLTVAYPASVRTATEAVRAHVRDRVTTLTELRVTRVDITVAALTRRAAPTRRAI